MKFFHHFSLGVATLFDLAGHLTTENRDAPTPKPFTPIG